jgi:uncharacterized protein
MELSTLTRTLLFDTYGDMLTEKQRLCFDLRYNQDLSLGEIAELEGISRQAVRDNIVRTEALLQDMEQKIGAVARLTRLEAAEQQLQDAANAALSLGDGGKAVAQQILSALKALKE